MDFCHGNDHLCALANSICHRCSERGLQCSANPQTFETSLDFSMPFSKLVKLVGMLTSKLRKSQDMGTEIRVEDTFIGVPPWVSPFMSPGLRFLVFKWR